MHVHKNGSNGNYQRRSCLQKSGFIYFRHGLLATIRGEVDGGLIKEKRIKYCFQVCNTCFGPACHLYMNVLGHCILQGSQTVEK